MELKDYPEWVQKAASEMGRAFFRGIGAERDREGNAIRSEFDAQARVAEIVYRHYREAQTGK